MIFFLLPYLSSTYSLITATSSLIRYQSHHMFFFLLLFLLLSITVKLPVFILISSQWHSSSLVSSQGHLSQSLCSHHNHTSPVESRSHPSNLSYHLFSWRPTLTARCPHRRRGADGGRRRDQRVHHPGLQQAERPRQGVHHGQARWPA